MGGLQDALEGLRAMRCVNYVADHIFDTPTTRAEKLGYAVQSLAVGEHWRQQGLQKVMSWQRTLHLEVPFQLKCILSDRAVDFHSCSSVQLPLPAA